jgi:hypothetical protein
MASEMAGRFHFRDKLQILAINAVSGGHLPQAER